MVVYDNIRVGQRVEVLNDGLVLPGTVKYKGCLVGLKGEWVGVELDEPMGRHAGMYNARRYFQCKRNHGVFVFSNDIRFLTKDRRSANKYHNVRASFVDEGLFGFRKQIRDDSEGDNDDQKELDRNKEFMKEWHGSTPRYNLNHSISKTWKAPPRRPGTTGSHTHRQGSTGSHTHRPGTAGNHTHRPAVLPWISSPSIPQDHMPMEVFVNHCKQRWRKAHVPRESPCSRYLFE